MASLQVRKSDKVAYVILPKNYVARKGWKQAQKLDIIEGVDGSLIIREVR